MQHSARSGNADCELGKFPVQQEKTRFRAARNFVELLLCNVILTVGKNDLPLHAGVVQRRHRRLNKALSEQRDDEKHRYRAHKQRECHHKREFWAALVVEHADM